MSSVKVNRLEVPNSHVGDYQEPFLFNFLNLYIPYVTINNIVVVLQERPMLYLLIAVIVIALIAKSRSSNNQTDSDADIEKQNRILDEVNRTYGNIEAYEPQLEPKAALPMIPT